MKKEREEDHKRDAEKEKEIVKDQTTLEILQLSKKRRLKKLKLNW